MPDPWLLAPQSPLEPGASVELEAAESRHLTRVLRRSAGQTVVLTNGSGQVAEAVLVELGRGRLAASVKVVHRAPPLPAEVTLALGVLHTGAMDLAVQKAVEVGVATVLPVLCERSQLARRAAEGRRAHWQRVADQALKQCRRAWALEVAEPVTLAQVLGRTPAGVGVVADPGGGSADGLPEAAARVLLVGPEGGFDPAEEEAVARAGWYRLGLGPFVLRAETAAVVGSSLLVRRQMESEK